MELVEVVAVPEARVEFTVAELELLIACGERHYDAVCREVATEQIVPLRAQARRQLEGRAWATGKFRLFDTMAKILEMPAHLAEADEERDLRSRLGWDLREVLKRLNASYREANGR